MTARSNRTQGEGGRHRAQPARRTGPSRWVLGTAATVLAAVALLTLPSTLAYWTDKATVTSGSFTSGKLDLTVDGDQGVPSYTATTLKLTTMVPGESVAATVAIANAGDADFTWTPTVTTGGDLGPALTVAMAVGATKSNTTTNNLRVGACTGGTTVTSGSTATRLNKSAAAQTLCVLVSLPTTVGNGFQSKTSGSVTLTIAATQAVP